VRQAAHPGVSANPNHVRMSRYHVFLLLAFVTVWIWAAIEPKYPHDWFLENLLVFIFVPIILLTGRYFKLSKLSYTLITVFMSLHVVGSHYTYAEVPFGYLLQDWFDAGRNMYDRMVHFTFGLLLAYPVRELLLRVAHARGIWGYLLPPALVLAYSGFYEIIEWLVAERVDPQAGLAFLGAQGDVWDGQKDMLLALVGSILTMIVVALINWRLDPDFGAELRASFKIRRGDKPLGEEALREMLKNKHDQDSR
jgi:putative membrane protein